MCDLLTRKTCPIRLGLEKHDDCIEISGFGRPFGLNINPNGQLFITDMDIHAIFALDLKSKKYCYLSSDLQGWSANQSFYHVCVKSKHKANPSILNGPHSIDFDEQGKLYVTTYYDPCIHILDRNGFKVGEIGRQGSSHSVSGPATGFFDSRKRLLVSEYTQNSVIAYDLNGQFWGALGVSSGGQKKQFSSLERKLSASREPGGFDRLHMTKESATRDLIVADTWNHRLQRFDLDGNYKGFLGTLSNGETSNGWCNKASGTVASNALGGFNAPVAIAFHQKKPIMSVVDWGNNRIQLFTDNGGYINKLDNIGLSKPYDAIFIDDQLAIADSHNGRVILLPLDI